MRGNARVGEAAGTARPYCGAGRETRSLQAALNPRSRVILSSKEWMMNKDRIAGAAKEAGGAIKEKTGKVLGDKKMEVEGKLKKTEGKVQNAIGGVEDAADQAVRDVERTDKGRW
jgi:uncharacterized protein YjbJ (UPF0337 family)